METVKVKLKELNVNKDNPRKITKENMDKLVNSILVFPKMLDIRPIVVDETMTVLGGNQRYEALKRISKMKPDMICEKLSGLSDYKKMTEEEKSNLILFWKEWIKYKDVPIINADNLTEDEKKQFIIKDNNSFGEWDFFELECKWKGENLLDWGVDFTDNWNLSEEKINGVKEDDYSENIYEIKTDIKYGDLFEITCNGITHRLQCGDSRSNKDVEKLLNGEKADLIFTDPPYDLEDNYSTNIFNAAKDSCHIFIMNSDRLLIDNVNNGIQWFRKFFAVDFRQARLVSNNQPMTRVDLIAEFCKGKTKFNNLCDGFSTLIECAKIHSDKVDMNFGHKQAKRVDLPATFIKHYSKENELVVDLFGGSGTTLLASAQLGRKCYTQEFEPKYCQAIINRFKQSFSNSIIKKV